MKIILTQEVTGLGQPGDVVEVKDGYGRNYLLPRNVAIRWTRGGEKTVESIKKARASRAVRDQDHADEIKGKLEAAPVDVKVKAGTAGRLFGAVTTSEIAGALRGRRRGGRPSHDRPQQPDQDHRHLRGDGPAARRRVRHRGAQRHPCLTLSSRPPARPAPVRRSGASCVRPPVLTGCV